MTAGEICDRIMERVDDDTTTPVSVSEAEVLAAVNEGETIAAFLTLQLEKTATFTIPAATPWFDIRHLLTDYMVPLYLSVGGARVRPGAIADLDALNAAWQATAGTPTRYLTQGFDLMAVTPQPAAPATGTLTYASYPNPMTTSDTPAIPPEYHSSLVDYGIYRVRIKEGAQGLQRGLTHLNRFLDDMEVLGDAARARSRAANYDVEPWELRKFDRSRLLNEVRTWPSRKTST